MSRSINQVILLGHLGQDAETKFTTSGIPKTTFSLATSRRWKDGDTWKEETDWHNCILWRSENVAPYLKKGGQVFVRGRIQTRSYEKNGEKRYITEIVVDPDGLVLCSGGPREGNGGKPANAGQSRAVNREANQRVEPSKSELGITDEDVPF
jgi:single-strand DNA-binding protein